jgi:2-keto-3-deoxy-L-rhamnonate aldolase RhmA
MTRRASFAERLRTGDPLVGVFQKLATHQSVELMGRTGLDFAVLDAEHAPFDPSQVDRSMLASQAVDLPLLVRVARNAPDAMLQALDMGATGVFVPHVATEQAARSAVSACLYQGGSRGLSPSTRAGEYGGRSPGEHMAVSDRQVAVVVQIEDVEALDHLDAIASVQGVTGLFVGRADLAASMGLDWNDPQLDVVTWATATAARRAGVAAGAYLSDPKLAPLYQANGLSFFVAGSDQGALKAECGRVAEAFHTATASQGQPA